MSRFAPIVLPPSRADVAVGRLCLKNANPQLECALQVVSLLADEKAVLAAAAAIWIASRRRRNEERREADRLMVSVMLAGAVPHLFKLLVRRRRPDRSLVKARRNGIPRSGNAWDSFPSGHAVHMGAMAGSVARLAPQWLRAFVWPVLATLAATRVALLAHYLSDVVAGWTMGLLINRVVAATFRRVRPD